jgi:hypothetical protein
MKIGCSVDVANDGLEALAYLEETAYRKEGGRPLSVILMDLEMPNMDGLVSTLYFCCCTMYAKYILITCFTIRLAYERFEKCKRKELLVAMYP